jgi:hypothetical protein
MNAPIETSFVYPYYQLNKKSLFNYSKKYHLFLSRVSAEFVFYLQDEFNGLYIYFAEGNFHVKNEVDNRNIIAEINLKSKILENRQLIF